MLTSLPRAGIRRPAGRLPAPLRPQPPPLAPRAPTEPCGAPAAPVASALPAVPLRLLQPDKPTASPASSVRSRQGAKGEHARGGREPPAAAPARCGGSGHAQRTGAFPAPGRDLPSPAAATSPCFHSRDSAALRKPLSRARSRASMVPPPGPALLPTATAAPRSRPRPPLPQRRARCRREPSAHVRAAAAGSRHDSGAGHAGRARWPRPAGCR